MRMGDFEESERQERASKIASVNRQVWGWLSNHIDEILTFDPLPSLHFGRGVLGHRKGMKGKTAYTPNDLSDGFLQYLETPKAIREMSKVIDRLQECEPELYRFVFLKAHGVNSKEMDESGLFSGRMNRNGTRTVKYQRMNGKAMCYIFDSLPDDIVRKWGKVEIREQMREMSRAAYTTTKDRERVICPRCNGTNSDCSLCKKYPKATHAWDGTIPKWRENLYNRVIKSGREWY